MKHLIAICIAFIAVTVQVGAQKTELVEGKYILVRSQGDWLPDPEVVSLTRNKEGAWDIALKLEGVVATSSVHVIPASEEKREAEIVVSAVVRVSGNLVGLSDGSKAFSHRMITLTLHGKLHADGLIRGVLATTNTNIPGLKVSHGKFVLKPLEAQQDEDADAE